jgi:hypothetical protein
MNQMYPPQCGPTHCAFRDTIMISPFPIFAPSGASIVWDASSLRKINGQVSVRSTETGLIRFLKESEILDYEERCQWHLSQTANYLFPMKNSHPRTHSVVTL